MIRFSIWSLVIEEKKSCSPTLYVSFLSSFYDLILIFHFFCISLKRSRMSVIRYLSVVTGEWEQNMLNSFIHCILFQLLMKSIFSNVPQLEFIYRALFFLSCWSIKWGDSSPENTECASYINTSCSCSNSNDDIIFFISLSSQHVLFISSLAKSLGNNVDVLVSKEFHLTFDSNANVTSEYNSINILSQPRYA